MTVRITAVSAGAVEYLLRGAGCAEHDHGPSAAEQGRQERDLNEGGSAYLLRSAQQEAAGVWMGRGLDMVGMTAGATADHEHVRAVFGRLQHPTRVDENGDPVHLGSRPRRYKKPAERIAAAVAAAGPDVTPEQIEELSNRALGDGRKAVAYYDVTFSPVKSVSIVYTALLVGGRERDAAAVAEAHHEAVRAAMAWADHEVAYTRAGYHGKAKDGRSVGEYQQAVGLVMTAWQHSTSRAQEPQLHTHVAVLNRVVSLVDGAIRALDGRGFAPIKMGMDAIYRATYERLISERIAVVFALRPDGKAREIVGIDPTLCAAASSRTPQVAARAKELIEAYQAMHGRDPGPRARRNLVQQAGRESRAPKSHRPPMALIRGWAADKHDALAGSLDAALAARSRIDADGHPDQRGYTDRTRGEVLAAAVAATQTKYASWEVGNLVDELTAELARTPGLGDDPVDLANEVLRNAAQYGVVLVRGQEIAPVPQALQRADGRCKFRAHVDATYTTRDQLELEKGIVAGARTVGALRLQGVALELAQVELLAAGLGDDQAAAVLGILSSGRRGDVLIGPAGAGKSHAVAALARSWKAQFGGRVVGLATSQAATLQLAQEMRPSQASDQRNDDGLVGLNTSRFFMECGLDPAWVQAGRYQAADFGRCQYVRPGDLIIVDESGMSSTRELDAISRIVAAGGGKLVYTGDHRQLVAVDAGGVLPLLVADNGAYELREIHRFRAEWERDASVQLRAGDETVLGLYDQHGRLQGGTAEEMAGAAQRAWLADTLAGRESLLIATSNETAATLAGGLRAELVRLGLVQSEVLATLRDGNPVGVNDLIQARQNDSYRLVTVEGRGMVVNRLTYRVLGPSADGGLIVRSKSGLVAHLSARYVAEHVTLAYASTVYAAQGRTVDTCHGLIDDRMRRDAAYVTLTRGREGNYAYLVTVQVPDQHQPERVETTPRAALAAVLQRVDTDIGAESGRRVGQDAAASLTQIGTEWDLLTTEYGRDRYTDTLATLLPDGWMDRVAGEAGYGRLMRAVREAELAGHDPNVLLAEAVGARSLVGADSVSDVVRFRLGWRQTQRVPEREIPTGDWNALVAPLPGPIDEYARLLGEAAAARQDQLGQLAAQERPAWAVEHLGGPPDDGRAREEWVRRAGIAAAYRELRSISEQSTSLGAAPAREMVFHRALWQQAYAALGGPADALDYARASDLELREMRERLRREQTFAPHWVAHELRDARQAADGYHRDVTLWQAELAQLPVGSPERAQAEDDLAAARHLAGLYHARVDHLATIHAAREDWRAAAEPLRVQADLAGDELERRGLPRDPVPPVGEQTELFRVDEHAGRHAPSEQRQPGLNHSAGESITTVGPDGRSDQPKRDARPACTPGHELRSSTTSAALVRTELPEGQAQLFPVEQATRDLAAAQPLHARTDATSAVARQAQPDHAGVSVGEARRRAEVGARLCAERERRGHQVLRTWRSHRAGQSTQSELDRTRRDQGEYDSPTVDHARSHRLDRTGPGLSR